MSETAAKKTVCVGETVIDPDAAITVDGKGLSTFRELYGNLVKLRQAVESLQAGVKAKESECEVLRAERDCQTKHAQQTGKDAERARQDEAKAKADLQKWEAKAKAAEKERDDAAVDLDKVIRRQKEAEAALATIKYEHSVTINQRDGYHAEIKDLASQVALMTADRDEQYRVRVGLETSRLEKLERIKELESENYFRNEYPPEPSSDNDRIRELEAAVIRQQNAMDRIVSKIDPLGILGLSLIQAGAIK